VALRRVGLGLFGLLACWILLEVALWPDVGALAETVPERTAFMRSYEARHGRPVRVEWIPYARISSNLKRAVLVAEDIDFFSHHGFAGEELRQALRDAARERRLPRGASTISQQLAKNLWLSPARTPRRKVREALLTRALERHLDKRRIFEIYLNVVEFGADTFGCEAASRHFFGKSAAELTVNEAARLAAVLPRPASWNPRGNNQQFLRAVSRIEGRMRRASWLAQVI
jgi:monofunctional biosynthetic peptidoglycan transglycosylase